jgi:3-oxoacyl-[acyl-carrier-protein] synthase-3
VDMLIVATCSASSRPCENLAEQLGVQLRLSAAHMEVNAACAGFSYALATADSLIRTGASRCVLGSSLPNT